MKKHICIDCEHVYKRKKGQFLETNCEFFRPSRPQADQSVTVCGKFECGNIEKPPKEIKPL